MRRVKNQLPEKKKLNNSGSAMILALTVLSLIAILGIMALSSALLNVRMRAVSYTHLDVYKRQCLRCTAVWIICRLA